jgi:hypothetical protein
VTDLVLLQEEPEDLEAGTEFYFEEGELRLLMAVDQPPEERAAGFQFGGDTL